MPTQPSPSLTRKPSVSTPLWPFVLMMLLAFALRLFRLDSVALRGDEAYALLNWADTPFTESWWMILSREPHPMGALLLYRAWTQLGGLTEWAARLLPVLSSVALVAVVGRLALDLTQQRRAAWVAAITVMLNPFLLYHAQDARTLSTLATLSALNLLLLLRALRGQRRARGLYIVSQTLTFYLSYVEAFGFAAQMVLVLWVYRQRLREVIVRLWLPVLLLSLPVGLMLLNFVLGSRFETHSRGFDAGVLLTQYVPSLLFGSVPFVWAATFTYGALALILWHTRAITRRYVLIAFGVPLGMFAGLSLASSGFFLAGYLIGLVVPLSVGVGALAVRRYGLGVALAVWVLMLVGVARYWTVDPPKSPDWRGIAANLEARRTERSVFVVGSPDTAAEYYVHVPLYFIPPNQPNPTEAFAQLLETYDAVFVSGDARAESARVYYQNAAQRIDDGQPLGVSQFRAWDVPPREIATPLSMDLGGIARLRGWSLSGAGVEGATLMLYWEALRQTPTPYSVLLHLTAGQGDASAPVTALDHGIRRGEIATTAWAVGGLYRDDVRLPQGLPAGTYTLWIGLYETASGESVLPEGRRVLGTFDVTRH